MASRRQTCQTRCLADPCSPGAADPRSHFLAADAMHAIPQILYACSPDQDAELSVATRTNHGARSRYVLHRRKSWCDEKYGRYSQTLTDRAQNYAANVTIIVERSIQ